MVNVLLHLPLSNLNVVRVANVTGIWKVFQHNITQLHDMSLLELVKRQASTYNNNVVIKSKVSMIRSANNTNSKQDIK